MRSFLMAMVACMCLSPAVLHAQALSHASGLSRLPQPPERDAGRHLEITVDDTGAGLAAATTELPVDPGGHTTIVFPEPIQRATGLPSRYFRVDVTDNRAMIYARRRRLEPGARYTVTLASESIVTVLDIKPAFSSSDAVNLVTVHKRSDKEIWEAALANQRHELEQATQALEDEKQALEQTRQDLSTQKRALKDATSNAMDTMAQSMLLHDRRLETTLIETGRDDLARVSLGHGRWFDEDTFYFPMELDYDGTKPFLAKRLEVVDATGSVLDAKLIGMDPPARARDGIITELQPGQHAKGVIRLSHMDKSSLAGLTIRLIDATGLPAIVAITQPWDISPPYEQVSPEKKAARERERRRRELDERERGKVSLHLQGVYGAAWLGDGTGADLSDATSMTGLGVRAQYGFNRHWAVEGELMGATTGSARFEGVTYDGAQGDLARSASLGRAQFGGVFRLGSGAYVLPLRLGVGLQGASHDGVLTTATGDAPGPDSFEWTTLATFGTGLDVRLGAFQAGISLSVVTPWGDLGDGLSRGSIEAGVHLGYAWKP